MVFTRRTSRRFAQRYLSRDLGGGPLRLPLVSIRLQGQGVQSFQTNALVDSGATASIVPPEMAAILGLEGGEPAAASGAGGAFDTRVERIRIEVLAGKRVAATFDGDVHVPIEEGRVPFVILGRDTIFLGYDITFREHRQLMVFRKPRRVRRRPA